MYHTTKIPVHLVQEVYTKSLNIYIYIYRYICVLVYAHPPMIRGAGGGVEEHLMRYSLASYVLMTLLTYSEINQT